MADKDIPDRTPHKCRYLNYMHILQEKINRLEKENIEIKDRLKILEGDKNGKNNRVK